MPTLSLRLDAETASLVDSIARRTGLTKSEVMRAAIKDYARMLEDDSGESFYDKIKDHVGRWESGDPYLSTRTGEEIAQMMLEERQRRDLGRCRTTRRAG
jgi:predicted DNA-binding protein